MLAWLALAALAASGWPPGVAAGTVAAGAAAASPSAVPSAGAAPGDALRDAVLATTCAQCHGPGGRPPEGSALTALAGRPASELIEAMRAYRTGERPGTLMPQLARGYDAVQVARIAAWFALQPRSPKEAAATATSSSTPAAISASTPSVSGSAPAPTRTRAEPVR